MQTKAKAPRARKAKASTATEAPAVTEAEAVTEATAPEATAPEATVTEAEAPAILPEAEAPEAEAPEAPPAPVATEAKPTAADKRAAYIADYAQAKAVYAVLNPGSASCPVKPANGFKPKPLNAKSYSLTVRGAASLFLAVLCTGKPLADGATYPRRFTMRAIPYITENGCLSDFIGTAYTIDSSAGIGNESFTLLPGATAAIESQLGAAKLAAVRAILAENE